MRQMNTILNETFIHLRQTNNEHTVQVQKQRDKRLNLGH
jgi:hypothetical protein